MAAKFFDGWTSSSLVNCEYTRWDVCCRCNKWSEWLLHLQQEKHLRPLWNSARFLYVMNTHTPSESQAPAGDSPKTGENVKVHFVSDGDTHLARWTWGKWSPVTTTDQVSVWDPTSVTIWESEAARQMDRKYVKVTFNLRNGNQLELDLWGMSRMDLVRALLAE